MSVSVRPAPARAPRDAPPPSPVRTAAELGVPVVAAAAAGLAVGLRPHQALAAVVGVLLVAMLVRVEWAAPAAVVAAPVSTVLAGVHPWLPAVPPAVLVVSWALRRLHGRLHAGRPGTVAATTAGLAAVVVLAALVHGNGDAGLAALLRQLGLLAVLLVLLDCLRDGVPARRLASTYVAACVAAAVLGLVAIPLTDATRVPGSLAVHLLVAAVLSVGLRRLAPRPRRVDTGTAVLLLGLLGTASGGALLGLLAGAGALVATGLLTRRAALGVVVVLLTLGGLALATDSERVGAEVRDLGRRLEHRVDARAELWRAPAEMVREHPLLGLGPAAVDVHHEDYAGPTDDAVHDRDQAHSTYLQVAAETGLLGLGALLALVAAGLAGAARRWRRDADPLAASVLAAGAAALVAGGLVTLHLVLPLWLLVALGGALADGALADGPRDAAPRT
ncbi:O-antigen ligase [Nocardioides sp. SYSU D00038]|uniref:O-antigen ligase family protein n=1 Tax=Nocardioides sp. SYSU D00038 TaxID=2812554 RepID=UPI0019682F5C|nr:O-antigen ligase family protein [Nocardioides sp. SYSU D00038]